jgi:hypothetical protein
MISECIVNLGIGGQFHTLAALIPMEENPHYLLVRKQLDILVLHNPVVKIG